jgi:rod shape-determining protein MreD
MNIYLKNGFRFVVLLLLQIFVFDGLSLYGFLIPYVYVAFILFLPFGISKSRLLLLGFFTGIIIDIFGNTLGLHAAATTLLAFARPGIINFFFGKMEFHENEQPGIAKLKFQGFLKYSVLLVFLHHFALIFLEVFSFRDIVARLEQVVLNTVYTVFVIFIIALLFPGKRNRY